MAYKSITSGPIKSKTKMTLIEQREAGILDMLPTYPITLEEALERYEKGIPIPVKKPNNSMSKLKNLYENK